MEERIVPLGEMEGYGVAEGDPDIRGWDVIASDERAVGRVRELLVDRTEEAVRYMEVSSTSAAFPDGESRRLLIPIGCARVDEKRKWVWVDALRAEELLALPAYEGGPLAREQERVILHSFMPADAALPEEDFYAHELYDARRCFGG